MGDLKTQRETPNNSKIRLKETIHEIEGLFVSVAHFHFVREIWAFLLRLLWNFIHLVISTSHFLLGTANTFQSYLISSGLLRKYKALDLTELQYLAIVVDSEEAHNTSKIVELLHWLSIVGVKNICLYDMDGKDSKANAFLSSMILIAQNFHIFIVLGVLKVSKEIILEELADKSYEKGTCSDQKEMAFEFSSFSDGKEGAAKAANFLCSKYLKDSSLDGVDEEQLFTESKMTEALRAVDCGGPEPNLLLVFGLARCHLGFPAWRMRYTEIVHMGPLKAMKYGAIVKAIYKFTTVRQNYGS
ncbi:hypothetical protein GIB67_017498 [Kingdonia uniflora]|uniref:ditrans,polycis-polyprenyl diphosphate synthase [(2E,6E)-farnesyldiphosphate specific] n=1 Tax=Kingdonia uniflora TaxID=39325 RepID=A0A7J7M4H2_9MAGN|nr:hypothetical protein GIB67_017498 [Kingdonia uniflora]